MIHFIVAQKKIERIYFFFKIAIFQGLKKALYYHRLYIFFSEKKFKNFFKYSKKKTSFTFNNDDYFNKLCIEYLNAISFNSFEDAAKLRLKINDEYKLNKKFKELTKFFLDLNLSKNLIKKEKKNNNFKKFIKDKELIFFGPGTGRNLNIKDDKVIVCTNITDEILKYKINKKISYFSNRRVNLFKDKTIINIEKCDYSVIKSKFSFDKLNIVNKNLRYLEARKYFLFGSPMMLQLVLLDLINHGPKKIILKNFDLYSEKILYRANYRTEKKNNYEIKKKTTLSLREHDALSNFIFFKNLYLNYKNLIILDKKLEEILKLKLVDYAKILDRNLTKELSPLNYSMKKNREKNEKY